MVVFPRDYTKSIINGEDDDDDEHEDDDDEDHEDDGDSDDVRFSRKLPYLKISRFTQRRTYRPLKRDV